MRSVRNSGVIPAARTAGLLVERVGDETVIYDTETKQAHCLKPLAAFVFEAADGSSDAARVAALATERLGERIDSTQVLDAVAQLEQVGLLASPLVVVASDERISRRAAVKRIGAFGAAATSIPLVMSIVAPAAAFASGVPTGCTGCNKNTDCVSGHCCQSNAGKSCNQNCCVGNNNSCHFVTSGGTLTCTVCLSQTGCGACPCSTCPTGTTTCCNSTC